MNQLLSVELDGKTLGTDDYEAKEGSIIVNLKSQAIEELPAAHNNNCKAIFIDETEDTP